MHQTGNSGMARREFPRVRSAVPVGGENGPLYFGGWDYTLHAFSVPGAAVSTATRGLHVA